MLSFKFKGGDGVKMLTGLRDNVFCWQTNPLRIFRRKVFPVVSQSELCNCRKKPHVGVCQCGNCRSQTVRPQVFNLSVSISSVSSLRLRCVFPCVQSMTWFKSLLIPRWSSMLSAPIMENNFLNWMKRFPCSCYTDCRGKSGHCLFTTRTARGLW